MSALLVRQAGPMVTIQDPGRPGLLDFGVSGSGPMDAPSMRIANWLVGNDDAHAALEFATVGGTFEVETQVRFAVTGGAVEVSIDGVRQPNWESHELHPGQVLKIGALRNAVWGYLAISGGIATPPVLGSRSTHLRSGIGGLDGKRLEAGARLPLGEQRQAPPLMLGQPWIRVPGPIRIVAGPQDSHFDERTWRVFLGGHYAVSPRRDRMAQMLDGPALSAAGGHDIVSDGTVSGSIQVPGSGQPLVLMAERQTTGGYPKIATVASVDMPRLAQMVTGVPFCFRLISQEDAEELLIRQRLELAAIKDGLQDKSKFVSSGEEVRS